MDFAGCSDEHLPLMEFAYNNNYQATIQMVLFEALYGRRFWTPVFWEEVGTQQLMGPKLVQRIGAVAYRLVLPPTVATVHNVFHVSMLRKYTPDPTHIIEDEALRLREDLSYEEAPIKIISRDVKRLRNKEIPLVKVLWGNHLDSEATWERDDDVRKSCLKLFQEQPTFGDKSS
ncbi:uncharacterized protein LOC111475088 [Cucurbita maxima]|uniref:Uncharacterized protein LOC111475088 n=1 Tax=Cucurbita maxima TaxID=3661 RepID=A0A6J1IEJ0_CUCMA|nr:uncharacterized protein LOC111475088 [Cucurbita maxima]